MIRHLSQIYAKAEASSPPNTAVILSARGPKRFLQLGGGKRRIRFLFATNFSGSELTVIRSEPASGSRFASDSKPAILVEPLSAIP